MIRFVANYGLLSDDVDAVDALSDRLMETLVLNADILEPDVAVSMTDRKIEILMIIATTDAIEAVERGHAAVREAFALAGHSVGEAKVFIHRSLIGPESSMRTELVTA